MHQQGLDRGQTFLRDDPRGHPHPCPQGLVSGQSAYATVILFLLA